MSRARAALAASAVSAALALLTSVWPDWIELVAHVDPDGGSGSTELLIAAAFAAAAVIMFAAGWHWRAVNAGAAR